MGWYFYDDTSPGGKSYGSSHFPDSIEKQREIGQRILAREGSNVIGHPIVFAIEQQTLAKYPDAETRIGLVVENINQRLSAAGIAREFYIDHFAPAYDKNHVTSCKAREPSGGYFPEEYCNHPGHLVFVAVDEAQSKNYPDRMYPSVEWHGVKESIDPSDLHELFTPNGISVLAHELGHILGLPDLYLLRIGADDNLVNHQAFPSDEYNPFEGHIMFDMANGAFQLWEKEIVDRENAVFPARYNTWFDYQPENTVLHIVGQDGSPLPQAEIKVYLHSRTPRHKQEIDDIPEYSGQTDGAGKFSLGSNVLGANRYDAIKVFLVEIEFNGQVDYQWFNFIDVNFAFWKQENILIESTIYSQN